MVEATTIWKQEQSLCGEIEVLNEQGLALVAKIHERRRHVYAKTGSYPPGAELSRNECHWGIIETFGGAIDQEDYEMLKKASKLMYECDAKFEEHQGKRLRLEELTTKLQDDLRERHTRQKEREQKEKALETKREERHEQAKTMNVDEVKVKVINRFVRYSVCGQEGRDRGSGSLVKVTADGKVKIKKKDLEEHVFNAKTKVWLVDEATGNETLVADATADMLP